MPKGNKGMLLLVCLNVALAQPDLALSQLEVALAQPDVVLAQLDVVLAQLDVVLAQPDVALDQLDVVLAHLDKLSYGWMTQPDIWWVAHVILESALGPNFGLGLGLGLDKKNHRKKIKHIFICPINH